MRLQKETPYHSKMDKDRGSFRVPTSAHLYQSYLLQISQKLQSSLEVRQQLEIFFHEIQKQILIDSISFQQKLPNQKINHKNNYIELSIGNIERHRCQYKLVIEEKLLGTLECSRKQKFSADEMAKLESFITLLVLPVRNALLYREAMQHAMTDTLTGVGNRAHLNETLERELKLSKRHHYRLSLLLIDVDYFKSINDQYGHQTGDMALKMIADGIRDMTRDTDRIFRFGGDEFVVLLDNTDECRARLVGERIRMHIESFKKNIFFGDHLSSPILHVTIGTATLLPDDSQQTLFSRADSALYRAKQKGRNCVESSLSNKSINDVVGYEQPAQMV